MKYRKTYKPRHLRTPEQEEEELDLIRAAQAGCRNSEAALLQWHEKLVFKAALPFRERYPTAPWEDLVQWGRLGLLAAIRGFTIGRGVRLSTYADLAITRQIQRGVEETEFAICRPAYLMRLRPRLFREVELFYSKHGRNPSNDELSEILGVGLRHVEEAREGCYQVLPLYREGAEGVDMELEIPAPGRHESETELTLILGQILAELSEPERQVLYQEFWEGRNLREVGDSLGCTREWARQYKMKALRRVENKIRQLLGPHLKTSEIVELLSG